MVASEGSMIIENLPSNLVPVPSLSTTIIVDATKVWLGS